MYTILGPDGPVTLVLDGDLYVIQVLGRNVTAGNSPFMVTADPPLGPINTVDLGAIYRQAMALLA